MSEDSTFQICLSAFPMKNHPDYATHGEAAIVCWIVRPTVEVAEEVARASVGSDGWTVLECTYAGAHKRDDFENEEHAEVLEFFDQAQIDKEVFVYHVSPRFSVYHVVAEVVHRDEGGSTRQSEAHYLVSGEAIADEGSDFYDLEFWSKERAATAVRRAHEMIENQGWEVQAIVQNGPADWITADDELTEFCELAEDDGESLIFVHDEPADEVKTKP